MSLLDQLQALPSQWEIMLHNRFAPVIEELKLILTRTKNPIESTFSLGCTLMRNGKFDEAKIRFKIVTWRRPAYAAAWYNLAICHFALDEKHEGLAALNKSLAFNDKDEMALYLKATYEGGKYAEIYAPHTTPIPMLEAEFGEIADRYSANEIAAGYNGHQQIAEQISALNIKAETTLDAGCGTGLCGSLVKPYTEKLIGLDIVTNMLQEAKDLTDKPYDSLLQSDLRDHLLQVSEPIYDLICSANVMSLIGGLTPVMDGATKALKPGGHFIFTTYALQANDGYRFINDIKRFAHSANYLKNLAEKSGLKAISLHETSLYKNAEEPSRSAYMVILQK